MFYLLHGAYDSDDSWSTVGRANFILDNLIASGAAVPMIVVMPAGHTAPLTANALDQMGDFERDFTTDIKPYIEAHYPVKTGRAATAIAGLSMGGGQTMDIAFGDLDEYGYVGVFSSGVFSVSQNDDWEKAHLATLDNAKLKKGMNLVWFGIGSEDFLLDTSKATVSLLKKHGFDVSFNESTGGHTWINWRDYLHAFAPQLFH